MTIVSLNQFGSDVQAVESLYEQLPALTSMQYVLDFKNAGFVKTAGIMALVLMVRHIAEQSGYSVRLINLAPELLSYLERVDFFEMTHRWVQIDSELAIERWSRNPQTANLLELTRVTDAGDVALVMERAEAIFRQWLQLPNLGSLLKVISELCSNIYQHSNDPHGFVMLQRYCVHSRDEVDVLLVAGDLGQGIRSSLEEKHPELGEEPLPYIEAALEGSTSRRSGRGGLGLRVVEETVASEGGFVWLRSETAAIRSYGPQRRFPSADLAPLPGTQVVVEFRAPLRD